MMVTFVSQCEKKALNRTRRVLDAFANRIGDNTWQTVITNEGLNAVRKLLKKTASKSTAVSCHWIRSRSRSELVWVVGNRDKFNEVGVVPVNSTQTNMLNSQYESDWQYLPLIKALTAISALFHDWGKASKLFQNKLLPNKKNKFKGDPVRHEWVSCLLLKAFVQSTGGESDHAWLNSLALGEIDEKKLKELALKQNAVPLSELPNAAKLVAWLIVSHHKLPLTKENWSDEPANNIDMVLKRITQSWGYENRQDEEGYQKNIELCFDFPNGLLSNSNKWLKQIKKWSNRLHDCLPLIASALNDGSYRLILHHSRLCLMLGDHYYSSQKAALSWRDVTGLFANTDRETKELKQKLDEHLVGVAKNALRTTHLLPAFEKEPPVAEDIRQLKQPSPNSFRWQDKAVDKINQWRIRQTKKTQGFFAINMASTGSGKTFANAKIMRALSVDGNSLRYILALGLRTLTLQTGDEYRKRIGLDDSELAVLIGSKAILELHNQTLHEKSEEDEFDGSESREQLLDEEIEYDCEIPVEGLATVLTKEKDRQFLYAPVLVCTIDHVMAATETKRGGRYILPCLRLMSSDLVIDESDDFTGSDLIAIGRLIHLAGMLGRKVMISSATIPPDLAEGYFNAYKKGWQLHALGRDSSEKSIGCAWVDEFNTEVLSINCVNSDKSIDAFKENHCRFVDKRVSKLADQVVKRKAEIILCKSNMEDVEFDSIETKQEEYFSSIKNTLLNKHHQHNTIDIQTGKLVSFGVIRVANISPCVEITRYLLQAEYPNDVDVRVMAYHSQQVLLLRHEQEKHLDLVLKRGEEKGKQPKSFSNETIRNHLDNAEASNIIFIIVATPVEEVGRDHDFDWAVVEPSSYRSIIQLAGRVRRHRKSAVHEPNVAIMQYNWRAFESGDQQNSKYFNRPGYEEKIALETHDLTRLIDVKTFKKCLDATPRIQKKNQLEYRNSLVDLEHYVTQSELTSYHRHGPEALQGYLEGSWFLTALPQCFNPFRKSEKSTNLFLAYDLDEDHCFFSEKDEKGIPVNREGVLGIQHGDITKVECNRLWLVRDYRALLRQYSEKLDLSERRISLRYGELNVVLRDGVEYQYNDQFGLTKM